MLFFSMHVIHLLTVILWIGGLAFVTGIVLPMAIKTPDSLQKVLTFQRVEHRFAPIAKWYNIITGISGFVMVYLMGWFPLYFTKAGAALTIMTMIWFFWFILLVGLEPIIIKKMLDKMLKDPSINIDAIFSKLKKLHWVMVGISLVAATAGAFVAHGPFSLY